MATIFLLAAPFKGECKVKGYEGTVELDSASFSTTQAYRVEQQGGGAQASGGDLSCMKFQDAASLLMWQHCVDATTIDTVEIHLTKQIKDTPIVVLKAVLGNVVISQFSMSSSGQEGIETFSLNYGIMKLEYTPVDEKGKKGGATTAGYDFVGQTPC